MLTGGAMADCLLLWDVWAASKLQFSAGLEPVEPPGSGPVNGCCLFSTQILESRTRTVLVQSLSRMSRLAPPAGCSPSRPSPVRSLRSLQHRSLPPPPHRDGPPAVPLPLQLRPGFPLTPDPLPQDLPLGQPLPPPSLPSPQPPFRLLPFHFLRFPCRFPQLPFLRLLRRAALLRWRSSAVQPPGPLLWAREGLWAPPAGQAEWAGWPNKLPRCLLGPPPRRRGPWRQRGPPPSSPWPCASSRWWSWCRSWALPRRPPCSSWRTARPCWGAERGDGLLHHEPPKLPSEHSQEPNYNQLTQKTSCSPTSEASSPWARCWRSSETPWCTSCGRPFPSFLEKVTCFKRDKGERKQEAEVQMSSQSTSSDESWMSYSFTSASSMLSPAPLTHLRGRCTWRQRHLSWVRSSPSWRRGRWPPPTWGGSPWPAGRCTWTRWWRRARERLEEERRGEERLEGVCQHLCFHTVPSGFVSRRPCVSPGVSSMKLRHFSSWSSPEARNHQDQQSSSKVIIVR